MEEKKIRKLTVFRFVFPAQVTLLLIYLNINVVNVGQAGTALPLLALFMMLSGFLFLVLLSQGKLYIRSHLLFFLLLITWVVIRIIIDLGDLYYLKQITVATTGGMLLFYFLGAFLILGYQTIFFKKNSITTIKYIMLLFSVQMFLMVYSFSKRIRDDLFYLHDVNGLYQRSGNFLSISFIIVSFTYFLLVLDRVGKSQIWFDALFWFFLYTVSTLIALVGSQLFGSNSATAIILGVYLITIVLTLVVTLKIIWLSYNKHELALPYSKLLLKIIGLISIISFSFFVVFLSIVFFVSNFDLTSINLLGFGAGENNSLLSRIDIIQEMGVAQMSYAPFFGNINVAYLVSGESGRFLHSFFPYVFANLGLVGLIATIVLFYFVFMQLRNETEFLVKVGLKNYKLNFTALYFSFILLYLLFFANLATDLSWAVLWFALGFISRPLSFK